MLPPLPRRSVWAYCFAQSPSRISLPRKGCRVGLRIVLFEACLAFTLVAACTLALSPIRDTHSEGFSQFVTSVAAPVASGWSGCRVGLAPTGKRRLVTAHTHSRPSRLLFRLPSVDPLTRDLPGPRIEHQAHRRAAPSRRNARRVWSPLSTKNSLAVMAATATGAPLSKSSTGTVSGGGDQELAVLDGDLQIGRSLPDPCANDHQLQGLAVAHEGQPDRRTGRAAQPREGLVDGTLDRHAIDPRDDVPRKTASSAVGHLGHRITMHSTIPMRALLAALAGLLSAAVAPAIIFAVFPASDEFALTFTIGLADAFAIGLPLFLLGLYLNRITWWTSALSGFVAGAGPFAIWTWPFKYSFSHSQVQVLGTGTHLPDGPPNITLDPQRRSELTAGAWTWYAQEVALLGCIGAVSALAFWACWRSLR